MASWDLRKWRKEQSRGWVVSAGKMKGQGAVAHEVGYASRTEKKKF